MKLNIEGKITLKTVRMCCNESRITCACLITSTNTGIYCTSALKMSLTGITKSSPIYFVVKTD